MPPRQQKHGGERPRAGLFFFFSNGFEFFFFFSRGVEVELFKSPDRKQASSFPDLVAAVVLVPLPRESILLLSFLAASRQLLARKGRSGAFFAGERDVDDRHSDAAAALDDRVVLARRASGSTNGLADCTKQEHVDRLEEGEGDLWESGAPSRSEEEEAILRG